MACRIKPGERVKIISVEIAVSANLEPGECADGINGLLTENGIFNPGSVVLDWRYAPADPLTNRQRDFDYGPVVIAPKGIDEGLIFRQGPKERADDC